MEQAVNLFAKGLLLDTHPMVQDNNSLSDCANGTFVTMNGDEIILQNDMGNRRVDNAFLPAGYEPVGIKEFGGVIYLALYNPILGKSQIGSFPSPERIIDNKSVTIGGLEDTGITIPADNEKFVIGNTFKELVFDSNPKFEVNYLQSLNRYTQLSENSLRAGDKFNLVVKNKVEDKNTKIDYKELLSNCFNTTTDKEIKKVEKIYSPKNKNYTLRVGVLNSQNEFVDITDTLVRYGYNKKNGKEEPYIIPLTGKNDLYKHNRGYFIKFDEDASAVETQTYKDKALIEQRQHSSDFLNTYAYKLVGPLYMETVYNTILRFDYIMNTLKNDNNVYIRIEGTIYYNCSDGESKSEKVDDDIYYTYEIFDDSNKDNKFKLNGFDIFYYNTKSEKEDKVESIKIATEKPTISSVSYDPSTNLYSATIVKEYQLGITEYFTDKKLEFLIGVDSGLTTESKPVLIKNLSEKVTLNLDDIQSSKIQLSNFRYFYNNSGEIELTYKIDSYPMLGELYKNLRMVVTDALLKYYIVTGSTQGQYYNPDYKPIEKVLINDKIDSGRFVYNWFYDNDNLEDHALFTVDFYYDVYELDEKGNYTKKLNLDPIKIDDSERFIITTELFNKFYNGNEYPDFKDIGTYYMDVDFDSSNKVTLDFEYKTIDTKELFGSSSSKDSHKISSQIRSRYVVRSSTNAIIDELEELPSNTYLTFNVGKPTSSIDHATNESIIKNYNDSVNWTGDDAKPDDFITYQEYGREFEIYNRDYVKGTYSDKSNITFLNVFILLKEALRNELRKVNKYSGMLFDGHKNPDKGEHHHMLTVHINKNNKFLNLNAVSDGKTEIDYSTSGKDKEFQFYNKIATEKGGTNIDDLFTGFSEIKGTFAYIFHNFNDDKAQAFTEHHNGEQLDNELNTRKYSRFWWRSSDSYIWIVLPDLIEYNSTVGGDESYYCENMIKALYGNPNKDIYVCYYKNLKENNIYKLSKSSYNSEYLFKLPITINNKVNVVSKWNDILINGEGSTQGPDSIKNLYHIPNISVSDPEQSSLVYITISSNDELFSIIDSNTFSNVIKKDNSFIFVDRNGLTLEIDKAYQDMNANNLFTEATNPIQISSSEDFGSSEDTYALLCNSYLKSGSLSSKYYDIMSGALDITSYIKYSNIPVIKRVQ